MQIEKLGLGSRAGKIKTAGAILCVGGTTFLDKGKAFHMVTIFTKQQPWTFPTLTWLVEVSCLLVVAFARLVGEVAQSISVKIQGNPDNMHHCVPTISSNRLMHRQEQGSMEITVEFGVDHNSRCESTEYCSNILLTYMVDC
ncbi:hypothetical protein F3Y22_tig00009003pilonHSYRG00004 [Hibiscus syriacus]|uniref:Uncharacterized protein n=1 Tax=Hibiscus syriacus TaxID=106335 RepID=A0A6A3C901_HIBSY|nr:hypothetical protein F3Y22_tig00009003pilonHSYRG00004 [Hibiscus syriacus]